jgi:Tfp pilus assembly protein PilX
MRLKGPTSKRRTHDGSRSAQRGFVVVVVMLFLIATVIFSLALMLRISSDNVIDSERQTDSTAAFFLAESGLDKGRAALSLATSLTDTVCTGVTTPLGGYAVGRGAVTLSGVSSPATCGGGGTNPACTSCALTATGTVKQATRTLAFTVNLGATNGTACNAATMDCTNATAPPPTWRLNLQNFYSTPAIALFSLAARCQGNNTGANCTNAACAVEWNINTSNGINSVGSMGNAVPIPAGGSYAIYQTLTSNYDLAEVGALFPGTGTGPTLTGKYSAGKPVAGSAAYWNDDQGGHDGGTIAKAGSTSGFFTNDGTWTDPASDICTTAPGPGSHQACTNWCYGGDTLVYGFAGSAASLSDGLSAVNFDTSGQNISLTQVAKFPTATIAGAPTDVYSEVWYAHNPDYLSNATASSGALVTGSMGSTFTGALANGSAVMTVSAITGVLHIGDLVSCNGGGGCPAVLGGTASIASQTSGTTGGAGTYTLSAPCVNPNCGTRSDKASSTKLEVTAVTNGYLSIGDTLTGTGVTAGTTVTAIVGAGNVTGAYGVSVAQNVPSTTITAAGSTIHVTGGVVPSGGIPAGGTLVSVRSVAGTVAAGTRVLASPAPTATLFKISTATTSATRLVGATICGGTCAFFQHGASATTSFNVTKSAGTGYWGSGFLCLKGVDLTPQVVTSSSTAGSGWTEPVQ